MHHCIRANASGVQHETPNTSEIQHMNEQTEISEQEKMTCALDDAHW